MTVKMFFTECFPWDLIIHYFCQVLADNIGLPSRIVKGCKYCNREDASSCLVRFEPDRYFLFLTALIIASNLSSCYFTSLHPKL